MNEDLAEHIKKLHLEKDDIIVVNYFHITPGHFAGLDLPYKNLIIFAPDGDIKKCRIEDLRKVVEAYDQALS